MADTDPGLSVHVKVTVDPSNTEAFLKALEPTFINVKAESLNIFCEVYKDRNNPGVFKLVENWNATLDHMMNVSNVVDSIVSLFSHVFYKVPLQGQDTEIQVRDTCTKSAGNRSRPRRITMLTTARMWNPCSSNLKRSKSSAGCRTVSGPA